LRLGLERTTAFKQRGKQNDDLIKEVAAGARLTQTFTAINDVYIDVAGESFNLAREDAHGLSEAQPKTNDLLSVLVERKFQIGVLDVKRDDFAFSIGRAIRLELAGRLGVALEVRLVIDISERKVLYIDIGRSGFFTIPLVAPQLEYVNDVPAFSPSRS